MRKLIFIAVLFAAHLVALAQGSGQWSPERAWNWYYRMPWLNGVNYIPSNAVNYTAMWDKTSFSPEVIDSELRLMETLGMNCVRVVMQHAVYADDARYFKKTFGRFLDMAERHGIMVMPVFFDDCSFGVSNDPAVGTQPEPLEGWYAWAWSPSPGYTMTVDERRHGELETYVKDMLGGFGTDPRILAWDLYNEPTNTPMPKRSWPLLRKVFRWAREANPSQPLTAAVWNANAELEQFLTENSDIITFHAYSDLETTRRQTERMEAKGRPVICTEWMNRPRGSLVTEILPMFREKRVGSMMWGLVNGKTQTHLPWGHRPEMGTYDGPWQHDLFRSDLTPYDVRETDLIKSLGSGRRFDFATMEPSFMLYGETDRLGRPFAKDPHVVRFGGRYLMYFSIAPRKGDPQSGWNIGIAESNDLTAWHKLGEITPQTGCEYERQGLCAPCALVRNDTVHLFYQTYGNRERDAICHAWSVDGIRFTRNATNPIFHPTGEWTCGRAIDAEVCEFGGRYFLYFATRDKAFDRQMLGVATAPLNTRFNREDWTQAADSSILFPQLAWEGKCIEGASIARRNGRLYMFYAGAYNNAPQQIGVAVSSDGIRWQRLSDEPFLRNGATGEWNACESGHPHLFTDADGQTYLFYQGNDDRGHTWLLSKRKVAWRRGRPRLAE